jgi:hypothetical protein
MTNTWRTWRRNIQERNDRLALVDLELGSRLDLADFTARSDSGVDLIPPTLLGRLVGGFDL